MTGLVARLDFGLAGHITFRVGILSNHPIKKFLIGLSLTRGKPYLFPINLDVMRNNKTGWNLSDFGTYQDAYSRYGGSVCSHPDVIRFLSENGPAPAFYGYRRKGELVCATYATDKHIRAGSAAYPFMFDDIIIPYNKHAGKIMLPFRTKQLSPYHAGDFHNCIHWKGLKRKTCVVKQDFSKATHKKRRHAYNKFLQAGGVCHPVDHFSNAELSDIYCRLFTLRWGTTLPCYSGAVLVEVFEALRHLVFGHVLLMCGEPCAYDLVFKAESPQWVFFDCIMAATIRLMPS